MGLGGISVWQLLIIFVILVVAFATIPLRHSRDEAADAGSEEHTDDEPPDEDEPGGGDAQPPPDHR